MATALDERARSGVRTLRLPHDCFTAGADVKQFCMLLPNLATLIMPRVIPTEDNMGSPLKNLRLRNLEVLEIGPDSMLRAGDLRFAIAGMRKLRNVTLSACPDLEADIVDCIAYNANERLQSLDINGRGGRPAIGPAQLRILTQNCPGLVTLRGHFAGVSGADMIAFLRACPKLRELRVLSWRDADQHAIAALTEARSGLGTCCVACDNTPIDGAYLFNRGSIENFGLLSVRARRAFTVAMANARRVVLAMVDGVQNAHIVGNRIWHVALDSCTFRGPFTHPLTELPALHELRLKGCTGLQTLSLESDRLNKVEVTADKTLTKIELRCPFLSELKITECPVLETLDVNAAALKDFSLWHNHQLAILNLASERLTRLEPVGCHMVRTVSVDAPLEKLDIGFPQLSVFSGRLLRLTDLTVGGPFADWQSREDIVPFVEDVCPNVIFLSLLDCRIGDEALSEITAQTPLKNLFLDHCPEVEEPTIHGDALTDFYVKNMPILRQITYSEHMGRRLRVLVFSDVPGIGGGVIEELVTRTEELEVLRIEDCNSVKALQLGTLTRLQTLRIEMCGALEMVLAHVPGLRVLDICFCPVLSVIVIEKKPTATTRVRGCPSLFA
jgi:hypothetical protein